MGDKVPCPACHHQHDYTDEPCVSCGCDLTYARENWLKGYFTWEVVDELRDAARSWFYTDDDEKPDPLLEAIADRIAALLPPRDDGDGVVAQEPRG